MTENTDTTAGPPPGPSGPSGPAGPQAADQPPGGGGRWVFRGSLRRARDDDRMVAGVAGGLGRYTDVDPLVFRVVIAVLTVFGGSGLLLYALAWMLIPEEGEDESELQRLLSGRGRSAVVGAILLAIVGIATLGQLAGTGFGFGGLVTLGALAIAALLIGRSVHNDRGDQRPAPAGTPGTAGTPGPPPAPGAYGQTPGMAYTAGPAPGEASPSGQTTPTVPPLPYAGFGPGHQTGPPPGPPWGGSVLGPPTPPPMPAPPVPPPPKPPRQRSPLVRATVSAAVLVSGLLVAWNLLGDEDVSASLILAAALVVVGIGLLVGAFVGGGRGLIWIGTLLALTVAATSLAQNFRDDGAGERRWSPESVADLRTPYELGAGSGRLDLTALDIGPGETVPVEANVGIGELIVTVPDDVAVELDATAGAGEVRVINLDGLDGDKQNGIGPDLEETYPGETTAGTLELDLGVGFGYVEVRRAG